MLINERTRDERPQVTCESVHRLLKKEDPVLMIEVEVEPLPSLPFYHASVMDNGGTRNLCDWEKLRVGTENDRHTGTRLTNWRDKR